MDGGMDGKNSKLNASTFDIGLERLRSLDISKPELGLLTLHFKAKLSGSPLNPKNKKNNIKSSICKEIEFACLLQLLDYASNVPYLLGKFRHNRRRKNLSDKILVKKGARGRESALKVASSGLFEAKASERKQIASHFIQLEKLTKSLQLSADGTYIFDWQPHGKLHPIAWRKKRTAKETNYERKLAIAKAIRDVHRPNSNVDTIIEVLHDLKVDNRPARLNSGSRHSYQ
jgi:hypothetical protein